MFNNTFRVGFTTKTGLKAVKDLQSQNTIIESDDGKDISVDISSPNDQNGFISILTDNQMQIKRISKVSEMLDEEGDLVKTTTNLNLPDIYDYTKIYNGGKVYYLYQDTTLAITMPALTISRYKIKYESFEYERILPVIRVTEAAHTKEAPFKLKINRHYHLSDDLVNHESLTALGDPRIYNTLPTKAQIGDRIEINVFDYQLYDWRDWIFYFHTDEKVNGNLYTDETPYAIRAIGSYAIYTADGWTISGIQGERA